MAHYLPCVENMHMPRGVRKIYLHSLRRIWFDFDCIAPSRRPVRTYARLKAQVGEATWTLARATKTFLAHKWDEAEAAVTLEYQRFVDRLELIVHSE